MANEVARPSGGDLATGRESHALAGSSWIKPTPGGWTGDPAERHPNPRVAALLERRPTFSGEAGWVTGWRAYPDRVILARRKGGMRFPPPGHGESSYWPVDAQTFWAGGGPVKTTGRPPLTGVVNDLPRDELDARTAALADVALASSAEGRYAVAALAVLPGVVQEQILLAVPRAEVASAETVETRPYDSWTRTQQLHLLWGDSRRLVVVHADRSVDERAIRHGAMHTVGMVLDQTPWSITQYLYTLAANPRELEAREAAMWERPRLHGADARVPTSEPARPLLEGR